MQTIFLGIPVLESFKAHTVDCLLQLFQYHYQNPDFNLFYSIIIGSRQVHFARNELTAAGLKQGADYIAFIDADMTFPADVLHRLYHDSKDIVGTLYKGRIKPHPYNIFFWNKDKTRVEQVDGDWKPPESKLVEVDGVGTGCMLIHKKVFAELGRQPFFYDDNRSEDIMFCEEARKRGFRIYVDTGLKMGHIGDEVYT